MRILFKSFVVTAALAVSGTSFATASGHWPAVPSRLALDTPYGNLHVSSSEYVYESRLMLDDREIEPLVTGLLNIPYAFSADDFHVALVSVDTGQKACPFHYKWVMLKSEGYTVTPRFGSCSEKIRVDTENAGFTMLTPSIEQPGKLDRYIYDGETVTHATIDADEQTGDDSSPGKPPAS